MYQKNLIGIRIEILKFIRNSEHNLVFITFCNLRT